MMDSQIWRRASSSIKGSVLILDYFPQHSDLPHICDALICKLYWSSAETVMETFPRQDEHDHNDSIVSTEDSITETEKEQLLGLLSSSDSPLRQKKSRVSRLCYVIALLFLSNVALLATLLVVRRNNEVAPQKSWLPPQSS